MYNSTSNFCFVCEIFPFSALYCPRGSHCLLLSGSNAACLCWAALADTRAVLRGHRNLMSNDSVQPAFIDAKERRQLLCDPPPGSFVKDSPALKWVLRGYTSTHSVYLSTERYHDFLAGEGTRAGCAPYIQKHERKGQKTDCKVRLLHTGPPPDILM